MEMAKLDGIRTLPERSQRIARFNVERNGEEKHGMRAVKE